MSSVSIAVGCAVGIPIGVGVIIGFCFWLRLQRKFKREEEQDRELERAVYDESGYINFDNINSWKQQEQYVSSNDGSTSETNETDIDTSKDNLNGTYGNKKRSSKYIPAYRKKINTMQQVPMPRHVNFDESNSSVSSLPSSNPAFNKNIRQVSVYDQMVPFVNSNGSISNNLQDLEKSSTLTDLTQPPPTHRGKLINSFQNQEIDLGSYYPRGKAPVAYLSKTTITPPSNSYMSEKSATSSTISIPKAGSLIPNQENVFATPKSEKTAFEIPDINKELDSQSVYELQNNYALENTNEITEEDQYENEFTNYSENRRQFIDSLRPH